MPSLAQRLREEGREEGREEVFLELAQRLLDSGQDPTFVARITELPLDTVKMLRKNGS